MYRAGRGHGIVMATLVTFLEALIVSVSILYATYCLVHLGLCCVRWTVGSIASRALKRVGLNTSTFGPAMAKGKKAALE
jgi:hypothetical protein